MRDDWQDGAERFPTWAPQLLQSGIEQRQYKVERQSYDIATSDAQGADFLQRLSAGGRSDILSFTKNGRLFVGVLQQGGKSGVCVGETDDQVFYVV
jgi:hypothetical protein